MTLSLSVSGMSCGHCASAIRDEVLPLRGVEDVEVDVPAGRVTVTGTAEESAVHAAIAEAGYEVVS
ncbi:heavy-metal-associated domain-containing protein [Actinomadura fibrosa]|uniref:Heavy-metal-associated domain-containing protein n=1 Tax=Actinomadura fibrosa TaxID=111802 RepID=A0ABW2XZ71_9ACTN|nr:heavy-metal-associated domain-containing protein [Actinomadura fibrosa]